MKAACKQRVEAIAPLAGREALIEEEINQSMRELSRAGRASWRALSYGERVNAASQHAADRILADAMRKARAALDARRDVIADNETKLGQGRASDGSFRAAMILFSEDADPAEAADMIGLTIQQYRQHIADRRLMARRWIEQGKTTEQIADGWGVDVETVDALLDPSRTYARARTAEETEALDLIAQTDENGRPRYNYKQVAELASGYTTEMQIKNLVRKERSRRVPHEAVTMNRRDPVLNSAPEIIAKMRAKGGMSYAQIAAEMGQSEDWVRARMRAYFKAVRDGDIEPYVTPDLAKKQWHQILTMYGQGFVPTDIATAMFDTHPDITNKSVSVRITQRRREAESAVRNNRVDYLAAEWGLHPSIIETLASGDGKFRQSKVEFNKRIATIVKLSQRQADGSQLSNGQIAARMRGMGYEAASANWVSVYKGRARELGFEIEALPLGRTLGQDSRSGTYTVRGVEVMITRSYEYANKILMKQRKEWGHLPRDEQRIGAKFIRHEGVLHVWDGNYADHSDVMLELGIDYDLRNEMEADGDLGTATNIGHLQEAIAGMREPERDAGTALDQSPGRVGGRGEIVFPGGLGDLQGRTAIRLFQGNDESTILHEAGHWYLELVQAVARDAGEDAPIHAYLQEIRDWMGLKDGQRIGPDQHELWARTFEAYLREGKAPSIKLQTAFRAFSKWLRKVYADLMNIIGQNEDGSMGGVQLDARAKSLFDRLLATEAQIKELETQNQSLTDSMFASRQEAGMTETAWTAYQASIEAARNGARDDLMARAYRAVERKYELQQKAEFERRMNTALKEVLGSRQQRLVQVLGDGGWRDGVLPAHLYNADPNTSVPTQAQIDEAAAFDEDTDTILGQYMGLKALTADMGKYAKALIYEMAGADMSAIRQLTGWFKGPTDGRWRFEEADKVVEKFTNQQLDEIARLAREGHVEETRRMGGVAPNMSDKTMWSPERLDLKQAYRLGDLIDNEPIFKAYPQLRNIPVVFWAGMKSGTAQTVALDFKGNAYITVGATASRTSLLDVLVHETQHVIQFIELFHIGGSPGNAMTYFRMMSDEQQIEVASAMAARGWSASSASDLYMHLAGELEAFDTQRAFGEDLTNDQRLERLPFVWKNPPIPTIQMTADQLSRFSTFSISRHPKVASMIDDYEERLHGWAKKGNRQIEVTPEPGTIEYAEALAKALETEPSEHTRIQRLLVAWEKEERRNNGDTTLGQGRIAADEYRVMKREPGNFTEEEAVAWDAWLATRSDGARLMQQLDEHRGTPWARQAVEGVFTRMALQAAIRGETVTYQNSLADPKAAGFRQILAHSGQEGLWIYLTHNHFLGTASKPVNSVNSSFINCNPSKACAEFCYATKGHFSFNPSIIKSEAITLAVELDPVRAAKQVAAEYKATAEYLSNKALRLFDKGDGDAKWLPFIKQLNKSGVRVQIFSKNPAFLRAVPEMNLRLLSVDDTNIAMADANLDLKVAFAYGGRAQIPMLAKLVERDQVGVVLPIKIGQKILNKDEIAAMRAEIKGVNKYVCPVDAGVKKIAPNSDPAGWNCTKCDKNGGIGCFFGSVSADVLKSLEVKPITESAQIKRALEIRRQLRERLAEAAGGVADPTTGHQAGDQTFLREVDDFLEQLLRNDPNSPTGVAGGSVEEGGPVGEGGDDQIDPTGSDIILGQGPLEKGLIDTGFYSGLERAIANLPANRASAAQWKGTITGFQTKGMTKAAEIEWVGVYEWLDAQDAAAQARGQNSTPQIQKEDLLAFIRGNGVRVAYRQIGGDPDVDPTRDSIDEIEGDLRWKAIQNAAAIAIGAERPERNPRQDSIVEEGDEDHYDIFLRDDGYYFSRRKFTERGKYSGATAELGPFQTLAEAGAAAQDDYDATLDSIAENLNDSDALGDFYQAAQIEAESRGLTVQYSRWTEKGGNDEFELVIELPNNIANPRSGGKVFTDSHFSAGTDILGWMRGKVRETRDGNKIVFFEEFQPQRQQKARDQGIAQTVSPAEVKRLEEADDAAFKARLNEAKRLLPKFKDWAQRNRIETVRNYHWDNISPADFADMLAQGVLNQWGIKFTKHPTTRVIGSVNFYGSTNREDAEASLEAALSDGDYYNIKDKDGVILDSITDKPSAMRIAARMRPEIGATIERVSTSTRAGNVVPPAFSYDDVQDFERLHLQATEAQAALSQAKYSSGIADFPFKDTDIAASLMAKIALKYAADNDISQVGWTLGVTQSVRYSKAVQAEIAEVRFYRAEDGRTNVSLMRSMGNVHSIMRNDRMPGEGSGDWKIMTDAEMRSVLGADMVKAMREAMIAQSQTEFPGEILTIDGDEITIGDEGMTTFYDRVMVKAFNAIGKKHGGKATRGRVSGEKNFKSEMYSVVRGSDFYPYKGYLKTHEDAVAAIDEVAATHKIDPSELVIQPPDVAREFNDENGFEAHIFPVPQSLFDMAEKGDFSLFQSKKLDDEEIDPSLDPEPPGFKPFKLSREVLQKHWSKEARALRKYSANGGVHPDQAVEILNAMHPVFDYKDADEIVQELVTARNARDVAKEKVRAQMAAEHPDPFEDGTVAREAEAAAHAEVAANRIELELEAIARASGGRAKPIIAASKQVAAAQVGRMFVREVLDFDKWSRAERRHGLEAQKFFKAGDFAKAETAKSRQLVAFYVYRSARERAEKLEAGVRWTKKFTNEATRKNYDNEARAQIDQLLVRYNIIPQLKNRLINDQSLPEWVQSMDDMGLGYMIDIAPGVISGTAMTDMESMPIGDAEDVIDALRNIDHIARNQKKLLIAGKRADMEAAVDEMATRMADEHKGGKAEWKGDKSVPQKLDTYREQVHADHTKPEFMMRWLDGLRDGGPMHRYIFQPMADAEAREADMSATAAARLNTIFSGYTRFERASMFGKRYHIKQLGVPLTKSSILSMALNWGNEGNRKALIDGYAGLDEQTVMEIFDEHMTRRDWDVVQGIWDWINEFREPSFALQYKLTGVRPQAVEASPFFTKFGVMRGGYYPLKYDGAQSEKVNKRDEKIITLDAKGGNWIKPQTKKNHLIEREGSGGLPVKLDISVMQEHIYNVIHDLTHREALIDVYRLVNHPRIQAGIKDAVGTEQYRVLNNWLQNIAAEIRDPSNSYQKVLSRVRTGSSVVNMGWKLTTAIVQPLGIMGSVPRLGLGGFVKAVGDAAALDLQHIALALPNMVQKFFGRPTLIPARVQFALGKSAALRYRMTTFDRDVRDALHSIKGRADWDIVPIEVRRSFFVFTGLMDMGVTVPVWLTAYEQAMSGKAKGIDAQDDAAAVAHADSVVRMTQGSGSPKDLARIQSGGEGMRLFTQFYSYMSVLYNQLYNEQMPGVGAGKVSLSTFVVSCLFIWIFPAFLSEALNGRLDLADGEDEDDRNKRVFFTVLGYPLGTIIGIRDVVSSALSGYDYSITPVSNAFKSSVDLWTLGNDAAEDGEIDEEEAAKIGKKAVLVAGYWFALPARQLIITGDYIADVFAGESPNPVEDPALAYQENLRDRE